MQRLSDGHGLLVGGTSIGNLFSGDAERSYLTAATVDDPAREARRSHVLDWFFVSPYAYLRWLVLSIGEVMKEILQAQGERLRGIQPRGDRGHPYPLARAATNVILRHLVTSLVIEELYRGAPVIYADLVDYDEIAHHAGIERVEARDALRGIDRIVGLIEKAALDVPRAYRIVVLSDHGQSPGATFRQRHGERLEDVIARLMGGNVSVNAATARAEHAGRFARLVAEAPSIGGRPRRDRSGPGTQPDLVVAASGNLAQVSFPHLEGRATREAIDTRYPDLIDTLARHPGVGLLLVRSAADGPLVIGRDRATRLEAVAELIDRYGPYARDGLRRVDAMSNCGDIVVLSEFDPGSGEVAAFEDQIGSHGGLGGWQSSALILHPKEWSLGGRIVGAPELHRAIRAWLVR